MARTDAFLAALDAGARPDALDELLAGVERKEGAEAHVRCVDAWAQKLVRDDAATEDIHWIRARLAMALENAANAHGPRAAEFALEALRLHSELLDDPDGKERVAATALTLAAADPDRVFVAIDAVGDIDESIALLKRHAKSPDVKAEPLHVAQVRRAISRLYALNDNHEAAFFESLKVLRKAPFEPLYVDESLALAAQTGRNKELTLVLRDLAKDDSLPARLRASMYNKVGHLLERDLDDAPGAFDAYVTSLRLTPDAKGPGRHARRLASDLGVDFEMPEPLPEATVDTPAPSALLSWSSKELSATGAAFEEDRTEAVVPVGEFSSSQSNHPPKSDEASDPSIEGPPIPVVDEEMDSKTDGIPMSSDGMTSGVFTDGKDLATIVAEADAPPSLPFATDAAESGTGGDDDGRSRADQNESNGSFDDETIQFEAESEGQTEAQAADEAPTVAVPMRSKPKGQTPRAITIPGAAAPGAPTAMELDAIDDADDVEDVAGDIADIGDDESSAEPPSISDGASDGDAEADSAEASSDRAARRDRERPLAERRMPGPIPDEDDDSDDALLTLPGNVEDTREVHASDVVSAESATRAGNAQSDNEPFVFAHNPQAPIPSSGPVDPADEIFENIGGGPTLADTPLPDDAPQPDSNWSDDYGAPDQAESDAGNDVARSIRPSPVSGLSATGVPLDALEDVIHDSDVGDGFTDAEGSDVFSAPPVADKPLPNDDGPTVAAKVSTPDADVDLDAIAATAIAGGVSGAGSVPPVENTERRASPQLPSLVSVDSGEETATPKNANAKASRRKRKKKIKKEKQRAKKMHASEVIPGMRPEDLLPNRSESSPGRRAPDNIDRTIRTHRDQTLPTPAPNISEVEATIAEAAPRPPSDVGPPGTMASLHGGGDIVSRDSALSKERETIGSDVELATKVDASVDASLQDSSDASNSSDSSSREGRIGSTVVAEDSVEDASSEPGAGASDSASADSAKAFSSESGETASHSVEGPVVAAEAVSERVVTDDLVADAMANGDAHACIDLAQQLMGASEPSDAALLLAARAMVLEIDDGLPTADSRSVFLDAMGGHEERALESAATIKAALDTDAPFLTAFFVDVSERAGAWQGSADLLGSLALLDAPMGAAFERLDAHYIGREEDDERLQLWARARQAATDVDAQRALDKGRLDQLKALGRNDQWRSLHAECALASPKDIAVREAALAAWESAPDKERARFIGRLALALEGDDAAIALYRDVLDVRLAISDDLGAEAAARELLKVRPGDGRALGALTEILGRASHRVEDLIEVLEIRQGIAANTQDIDEVTAVSNELFALWTERGDNDQALDAFRAAAFNLPQHQPLLVRYLDALKEDGRWRAFVEAIESIAPKVDDDTIRVDLWVSAAEVAHQQLDDVVLARKCVDHAIDISSRHVGALMMRADLASAEGDADSAYQALERLAGEVTDAVERGAVHLRMGFLLEDDLDRPGDALRRYRAACDADASSSEALAALRALALKEAGTDSSEPASEHLVFALRGLVRLEPVARLRSVLLKQLAQHLLAHDDTDGAHDALRAVLEADPTDVEAREEILVALAEQFGFDDVEAALAAPTGGFVDAASESLDALANLDADAAKDVPFGVRRVLAMAFVRRDEDIRARGAFERLLDDDPTDALSLRTLADLLAKLETDDAQARRLAMLEQLLLHHGPTLAMAEQVQTWAEVCLLRRDAGQPSGALTAARRALSLATDEDLRGAIANDAAEAAIAVLEHGTESTDARLLISAHRLLAAREGTEAAAERLAEAASIAEDSLDDKALARQLLEEAVAYAPQLRAPREALLQLDIREGDPDKAIETTESLLGSEDDPLRRAGHHLRLSKLYLRAREDAALAADHLRKAIELDPDNATALDDAEILFSEQKDAHGLAALYAAQLASLPKDRSESRYALLERLAQVRRYDLRDLGGAVEALEAMGAIDPMALKPREDAARIYSEMGRWKEATAAWRAVLERDPVHADAWRGLSSLYARTEQADETFTIAAAMSAVELASDEVVRAVRAARPPFPRWPKVPSDLSSVRRRLSHDLERAPIRTVFDVCGRRLFRVFARPLKEFGVRKKDQLSERDVPGSVNLAVRVTSQLMGLKEPPKLVRAELGSTEGTAPPFALLPTPEPGLIVTDDVIRGGMTPERAFSLGRAMAWLTPHGLLAGTLDAQRLRLVLEALVHLYLPGGEVDGDGPEVRKVAKEISGKLEKGLGPKDVVALRRALADALRSYVHARRQRPVGEWVSGVAFTGDRLGYLLCGDLLPSFRALQQIGGETDVLGARLAIKELVLFSVSADFLSLRRDLGLGLASGEADALIELL